MPQGPVKKSSRPPYLNPENPGIHERWNDIGMQALYRADQLAEPKAKYAQMHNANVHPGPETFECYTMFHSRFARFEMCAEESAQVCGVKGCAAAFCERCISGFHDAYSWNGIDAAKQAAPKMASCDFCTVSICSEHQAAGLLHTCEDCGVTCCTDCVNEVRDTSNLGCKTAPAAPTLTAACLPSILRPQFTIELPVQRCKGYKEGLMSSPCDRGICAAHTYLAIIVRPRVRLQPVAHFAHVPLVACGSKAPDVFAGEYMADELVDAGEGSHVVAQTMCHRCIGTTAKRLSEARKRWEEAQAHVEYFEPISKFSKAQSFAPWRWAFGLFEVVESGGRRGWLRLGVGSSRLTTGSLTVYGNGEHDASWPEERNAATETLARFFVGLGASWCDPSDPKDKRWLPQKVDHTFSELAAIAKSGDAGASVAVSPRQSGNVLLPGLKVEATAAPHPDLHYDGFSNLGAVGSVRLWRLCDEGSGEPTGLLKGALKFPGRDEKRLFFTAFPVGSSAPRANSAFAEGELAKEDDRERKRAERMSRPGTRDYWRSDAPEDYSGAAAARGGAGDDDEDDEGSGEEDGPGPGMSMQHMMMGMGMMGMGSSDEGSDEQGECSDASQ